MKHQSDGGRAAPGAASTLNAGVIPEKESAGPAPGAGSVSGVDSVPKFDRARILESRRFRARRDALSVLLKDGARYSEAEVEALLDDYMKGKVI